METIEPARTGTAQIDRWRAMNYHMGYRAVQAIFRFQSEQCSVPPNALGEV